MRRPFYFIILCIAIVACNKHSAVTGRTTYFPTQQLTTLIDSDNSKVWVFILAGQSNMAGRGFVEPGDTISNNRIITTNKKGELILAKEPLHFYEPSLAGLDCGLSFAQTLLKKVPANVRLLLLPTAIGGSSISQWLNDSVHRNVKLYSNFLEKIGIAKKVGTVKAILWHQGESDANEKNIPFYKEKLNLLINKFRTNTGNPSLPVLIGELGSFAKYQPNFRKLKNEIYQYAATDVNSSIISTKDLKHRGDSLHFNSKSLRLMGKRFAKQYIKHFLDR